MKGNCSLDSSGILAVAEAGSDTLTVATGTDWKTKTEGWEFAKDFTFKRGFLSNTNVNNVV